MKFSKTVRISCYTGVSCPTELLKACGSLEQLPMENSAVQHCGYTGHLPTVRDYNCISGEGVAEKEQQRSTKVSAVQKLGT